jgi:predicted Zn-dependent peptidase
VSAADVRSLAREFWRPERFSLAVIGPDPQLVERAAEVAAPQARA